jgi:uncharacterized membrane protein
LTAGLRRGANDPRVADTGRTFLRLSGYVLAAAYFVAFTGLAWRLHNRFLTHALDLGYFDQIVWSAAHGQSFANTLKYPYNFMGDHLSPILFLVAPLYRLWPDVRALLAVQTLALAAAGLPVFWLARRADERWAPLVLLAFYLNPALHLVNLHDFHEIALSTPFVALALYALLRRRHILLAGSLFLALLCKEDVAILTLAFGVYLLFDRRARGWGIAISAFSVAWLGLSLQAIIPAFREEGEYGSIGARYGYLGDTPRAALKTLLTRPLVPLAHLAQVDIGLAVLRQLLPTGFVALLGWPVLALSLPVFLYLQLSDEPSLYTLQEWHVAPLVPILFVAAIQALTRLRGRLRAVAVALMVLGSAYACTQYSAAPAAWLAQGTLPERGRQIEAILHRIAPDSVVSAQSDLVPHVSQRKSVYVFPSVIDDAGDLVLDRQGNRYPVADRYDAIVDGEVLPRVDFRPVYESDGLLWLQKTVTPTRTADLTVFDGRIALRDATVSLADGAGFFVRTAGEAETLHLKAGDRLQVNLYWHRTADADQDYTAAVQLVEDTTGKIIAQSNGPLVPGRQTVKSWRKNELLRGAMYLDVGTPTAGRLVASLYETGSGRRLPAVGGGEQVTISRVE